MKIKFLLLNILIAFNLLGQNTNYSIDLIPDSLKENANVVIRDHKYEFKIDNTSNASIRESKVISILNKAGENHANIKIPYDKFSSVYFLEAYIYDKYGNLIEKVKNKDIRDISDFDSYSNLSDNRFKYIGKPVMDPPYTIKYKYLKEINGILFLPSWYPISEENMSVEYAQLIFKIPDNYTYNIKSSDKNGLIKKIKNSDNKTISWVAKGLKAIESEPFNTNLDNYVPYVLLAPNKFKISGHEGLMNSWNTFGSWNYTLNLNRDQLSSEVRNEINEIIKPAKNDLEKIQLVYEYMQSKTRYISIQLGIGGWQSFLAEETHRNGYGDCKALTIYTKALLKLIGIQSYYSLVKAGDYATPVYNDFVSQQFNHVILCVPNGNDTVWLECTSQDLPAGFLGEFTDDREALVTDDYGKSKLVRTPQYKKENNTQLRSGVFNLTESGDVNGSVNTVYNGLQYDYVYYLLKYPDDDKEKKLKKRIDIKRLMINSFNYEEKKEIIPSLTENLDISIPKYAVISSNRMFFSPNIMNKRTYVPRKISDRKTQIIFRRGYIDIDSVQFTIPEGYKPEYIPKEVNIENQFGSYTSKAEFIEGKLYYYRKFEKNKGVFDPETYNELREFYNTIYKTDKKTAVFVKE